MQFIAPILCLFFLCTLYIMVILIVVKSREKRRLSISHTVLSVVSLICFVAVLFN